MTDFNYDSGPDITEAIKGKIVESVSLVDDRADEYLVFKFTDKTGLKIRYDWLYDWHMGVGDD